MLRGEKIITDYFKGRDGYLRRFVKSIEPGETLNAREIAEKSGIPRSKVYYLMYLFEKRGLAERINFVWPTPPPTFHIWGKSTQSRWRREVTGHKKGFPGIKWRFLGFTITPIDDLLQLAKLDQRKAEI